MKKQRVTVEEFAKQAIIKYNGLKELTSKQIKAVSIEHNICIPGGIWKNVVRRGVFLVGSELNIDTGMAEKEVVQESEPEELLKIELPSDKNEEHYVPRINPLYVPHGLYTDCIKIVKRGIFFPTFVTGLSGNGKTMGLEQVCAKLKRKFFRINITSDTDEDDLMGGFRLVDGNTVWQNGPVIEAMLQGGVLVLDEIDLGTPKIMCLQSILEGNGYYIKKQSKWVEPSPGFQIFATANTKGKGGEHDQFVGTNILNEAFLDRFSVTIFQPYPSIAIETKILFRSMEKYFGELGFAEGDFITNLVKWGDIIRSAFNSGAVEEIITTRRLVDITKSYSIFKNKTKVIKMAVERFEESTSKSFLDLYGKIDAGVDVDSLLDEETEVIEDSSAVF